MAQGAYDAKQCKTRPVEDHAAGFAFAARMAEHGRVHAFSECGYGASEAAERRSRGKDSILMLVAASAIFRKAGKCISALLHPLSFAV